MDVLQKNLTSTVDSDLITDFSHSFSIDLQVVTSDIDDLGHMNNAVYVNWLDQAHLYHTFNLGITPEVMKATQCALVVRHTELFYLLPLRDREMARVGTRIAECDGKIRLKREFQIVNLSDRKTILRASIDYVCINFINGKPKRMPEIFVSSLSTYSSY